MLMGPPSLLSQSPHMWFTATCLSHPVKKQPQPSDAGRRRASVVQQLSGDAKKSSRFRPNRQRQRETTAMAVNFPGDFCAADEFHSADRSDTSHRRSPSEVRIPSLCTMDRAQSDLHSHAASPAQPGPNQVRCHAFEMMPARLPCPIQRPAARHSAEPRTNLSQLRTEIGTNPHSLSLMPSLGPRSSLFMPQCLHRLTPAAPASRIQLAPAQPAEAKRRPALNVNGS